MSATTNTRLGGTKERASVSLGARLKEAPAKKTGTQSRGRAAAKVGSAEILIAPKKNGMAQAKASERSEELAQDIADNDVATTPQSEPNQADHDGGEPGAAESNAVRSSKSGRAAVKALTEAGKKRLVNKLLGLAETQATQGGFKITPADLIRLMQLHKEMTPQKDRKVTVQWIEDRPE